jgi:hypothetical protein
VPGVDYRYELRRADEVVATGHLNREQPLEVGERLEIGGQIGIVRAVEPLLGSRAPSRGRAVSTLWRHDRS